MDVACKAESTRSGGTRDEAPDQSAQEILSGSLVEQVVPAEYDVAQLSTTETDPESEPSVADARAVEKAWQWTTRKPTRKRRNPETDVGGIEEDIGYREVVSGQDDRVNYKIILRAVPDVVLETCQHYFHSVCLNIFGFAQRVHIPSLRTVQHAALAHLAATAPSKLESREGCLHWWRVLLENFKVNSGSMSKVMRLLMRKDLQQLSRFDSCWSWSVLSLQYPQSSLFSQNLLKLSQNSCMELTLVNEWVNHAFSLIELQST